jgi:hypothetical protein
VQWKDSGSHADVGSSKRIDDAGHNLCPQDNAAIAGRTPHKRELADVVSKPQHFRSSVCDDGRHISMTRDGAARRAIGLREFAPAGKGSSAAKERRPPFYWRS